MKKELLIKKWLLEDLTSEERKEFEAFEDFQLHQRIIDSAQYFKASEVSEIKTYLEFSKQTKNKETTSYWYKPFLKIAAALICIVGIGSLFFLNTGNSTINQVTATNKSTFSLPDASVVVVNAGSQLTYNKDNWDNHREVTLKGEAFFKVKKGKTFDVITAFGKITVLGTEFSVKQREKYMEVRCFEGLVSVAIADYTKQLDAGHVMRIIDDKISFETTTDIAPSWVQKNISQFKSIPFYEVVKEFERQYDIKITLQDVDKKRLFTGGFVHKNLKEALKSITLPLELTYSISEDKKDITLSKQKKE